MITVMNESREKRTQIWKKQFKHRGANGGKKNNPQKKNKKTLQSIPT